MCRLVQLNATAAQLGQRFRRGYAARSPQEGVAPAHQLHHAEGLREVVVGARVEPSHLVVLGALRGEHHDGDVA